HFRLHGGIAAVHRQIRSGNEGGWLEQRNKTACATSSGSPTRPSKWKGPPTRLVLALSPWVRSSIRRHQVQPGDTEFTRILSAAKSMASLRVSCKMAALVTG